MYSTVQGIPVVADPSLSWQEVKEIADELIQTWLWEGKQLGRIELISDGQWVHVCSYEKPSVRLVSLKNYNKE